MNLLKINEDVKRLNKTIEKEKEYIRNQESFKKDLLILVSGIASGDEKVSISNDLTYKTLGLKNVKKNKYSGIHAYCMGDVIWSARYEVVLTKSNIRKIDNYIDNNGFIYREI